MNIRVDKKRKARISQGHIYKDVKFIEYVVEKKGILELSEITFPLVIVLTQDCDLEQDSKYRDNQSTSGTQDKLILSVLVAPLYNAEHVYTGQHLDHLDIKMRGIPKGTTKNDLLNNKNPRYHYLEFPPDIPIVASVIDFKHYFSVNVNYLIKKKGDFVCGASPLFREDISQRFAAFLSRIGLPEIKTY